MGIIEFFKKIIEVKNNDLSFLNVGDIIWARRYKNEEEKEKIEKGHRSSPYVIIKKTKTQVFGLQCTSNPHEEIKWKMVYYPIGKLNYELEKNSFINCTREYELKEIQFVETIGHLNDNDLNQLKKHLYIIKNSKFRYRPNIEDKYLDYELTIGDIILKDGIKYYIHYIDKKTLYTYQIKQNSKKAILLGNTNYEFIFEKTIEIDRKDNFQLVDTMNTGERELVTKYREKCLKHISDQPKKVLQVGALIDYKDKMFYIYKENSDEYNLYQVYNNTPLTPLMADIKIKGGLYRTYFNTVTVPKSKLVDGAYAIRRCATYKEIAYNEMVFNLPKKERQKARKELVTKSKDIFIDTNVNDFVPMMVLEHEDNKKYYLIVGREDNIIELVNIDNMGDYYYYELNQKHCPYKYARILSKEEFNSYLTKIQELKTLAASFDI